MNLNQLHYFKILARYEHYGRAAQELHISQPSLSKAIATMEEELGTCLFEKQGRNVALTKSGKHYLVYVENALSELERGKDYLRKEQSMAEGYIDLGIISTVEHEQIPLWIQSFRETYHKKVFFSCVNGTSRQLLSGIKDERYDLIFCTKIPNDPLVEFVPVFEQQLVAALPPHHPLAAKDSIDIMDLDGEDIITHTRSSNLWDITHQIFRESGIHIRISSEAEEDHTIIGLVRAGIGCSIVPDSPLIHVSDVCLRPLTGINYHRYVCMGYRKDIARPHLAELFRKHVLKFAIATE